MKSSWMDCTIAKPLYTSDTISVCGNIYNPEIYDVDIHEFMGSLTKGMSIVQVCMDIKKVIINQPATIILWKDGSKTIVKCKDGEVFDPEKGIAMAYIKHVMFKDKTTKCNKWFDKQIKQNEEK